MSDNDDNSDFMKRRTVLKSAAVGIFTSASIGTVVGNPNNTTTVEVPIAKKSDTEVTKEVPESWLAHFQKAQRQLDRVKSEYLEQSGFGGISLERDDSTYGGQQGFAIKVEFTDKAQVDNLPDTKNGIPINPVKSSPAALTDDCFNEKDWSEVWGALDVNGGTIGCVVEYDGKKMVMTNKHVVDPDGVCSGDDGYGTKIYMYPGDPDFETELGYLYAADTELDMALIEITNDNLTPKNKIFQGVLKTDANVLGYYYPTGVANLISNETSIDKMGTASGKTTGTVDEMYYSSSFASCIDYNGDGVRTSTNQVEGDSGCVTYKTDSNNDCLLIGLMNAKQGADVGVDDCDGDNLWENALGGACYEINNKWDITWDWT